MTHTRPLVFPQERAAKAHKEYIGALYQLAIVRVQDLQAEKSISQTKASEEVCNEPQFSLLVPQNLRMRLRYALKPSLPKLYYRYLTDTQESFLVSLVVSFSTLATALSPTQVRKIAQIIAHAEDEPSATWVESFLERNSNVIAKRSSKNSHHKFILTTCYSTVKTWVEATSETLKHIVYDPALVFNIDETKALPKALNNALIAAKSLKEVQHVWKNDPTLYTLVSCTAANGTTLFVIYLFRQTKSKKGVFQPIHIPEVPIGRASRSGYDYPIYYAVTASGYMNGVTWKAVLEIFIANVLPRQGVGHQKQAVLFLDGCSSHLKSETGDILDKHNITTIWFPSNTSHILQPLDGATFGNYKKAINKKTQEASLIESLGGPSQKMMSLLVSDESYREAAKPETIKSSFETRGIYPWEPTQCLANALHAQGRVSTIVASPGLDHASIADDVVSQISLLLSPKKKVQTRHLEVLNSPKPSSELQETKPKPPKAARKPRAKKAAKVVVRPVVEEEEDISEHDDDVWSTRSEMEELEEVFDVPESCSNCAHATTRSKLTSHCSYCHDLYICQPCASNPNVIGEHMKIHMTTQTRPQRKAAQRARTRF